MPFWSYNELDSDEERMETQSLATPRVTWLACGLAASSSLGGFIFGYESSEIAGFLQMSDFQRRFGENGEFSPLRAGSIVSLFCAGTFFGCFACGWLCDRIGRRYTLSASALCYLLGVVIEITSSELWLQFAMGRFVAGWGVGALSTGVPMYQSESVPRKIRGVVVAVYQLLIALGQWTAYMICWGTEAKFTNSAQWRIPNGFGILPAIVLMGSSILFLPESPRYAYRNGRVEEARRSLANINGVDYQSHLIDSEIFDIEEKLQIERDAGVAKWSECFTGPRMLYRTLLGMTIQAGQQLTGVNFFFYYGTTIFKSTGISNSFVTSIILGSMSVAGTISSFWVVANCGRRKALMIGAMGMCICFLVYSLVGNFTLGSNPAANPTAGSVLIVFTCIFIFLFMTTWGPLAWAVIGELYPSQYRAPCMALATASNWLVNFLLSFFTTFITDKIGYFYGLVYAFCLFGLVWIVYFFLIESKDRSLEEIDTMYLERVAPRGSASWTPRQTNEKFMSDFRGLHPVMPVGELIENGFWVGPHYGHFSPQLGRNRWSYRVVGRRSTRRARNGFRIPRKPLPIRMGSRARYSPGSGSSEFLL